MAPPQVMASPNIIMMIALVSMDYLLLRKLLLLEVIPAKECSFPANTTAIARQAKSCPAEGKNRLGRIVAVVFAKIADEV